MKKSFDIYTPKERIINLLRWNDALGSYDAGFMIEKPELREVIFDYCPSCGRKCYLENTECSDCRRQD
jgi:uncharacterized OB-fold protein